MSLLGLDKASPRIWAPSHFTPVVHPVAVINSHGAELCHLVHRIIMKPAVSWLTCWWQSYLQPNTLAHLKMVFWPRGIWRQRFTRWGPRTNSTRSPQQCKSRAGQQLHCKLGVPVFPLPVQLPSPMIRWYYGKYHFVQVTEKHTVWILCRYKSWEIIIVRDNYNLKCSVC